VIPFEFRNKLWCQKTRVMGLSCGVICVILRLAILIQYRSVTDTHTHTHRQTDTRRRHIPRLARRRAVEMAGRRRCGPMPNYFGHLFSPLGKLADSAIYFTFHNFFLFLNGDKLSQDPLDRFSQSLHQMIGICLKMTDLRLVGHG